MTVRIIPRRRYVTSTGEEISHTYGVDFKPGRAPLEPRVVYSPPVNHEAAADGAVTIAMSRNKIHSDAARAQQIYAMLRRRFRLTHESAIATATEALRQENDARGRLEPQCPAPLPIKAIRGCIGMLGYAWVWATRQKWGKIIKYSIALAPSAATVIALLRKTDWDPLLTMRSSLSALFFGVLTSSTHVLRTLIMRCATGIYVLHNILLSGIQPPIPVS